VTLQRLIITFKPDGHEVRVLYRRADGPGPGTKARRREVAELARDGLRSAVEALEERAVEMVGTARFEVREDIISADH
jgi:hypothetical protein